jgi:hypothetical protein
VRVLSGHPQLLDTLSLLWPSALLTVLGCFGFATFLTVINRHWQSLTPEQRQQFRESDEAGW